MTEIEKAINKIIDNLKWWRENEENGVVYIPDYVVESSIERLCDLKVQIRELQHKSEEVCEWRMPNDNADEWTPSCEKNSTYNVFGVGWFKYCPYCGRKIKMVQG